MSNKKYNLTAKEIVGVLRRMPSRVMENFFDSKNEDYKLELTIEQELQIEAETAPRSNTKKSFDSFMSSLDSVRHSCDSNDVNWDIYVARKKDLLGQLQVFGHITGYEYKLAIKELFYKPEYCA